MSRKIIAIHSITVRTRKEFWPKADLSKHFTTWMQESKDAANAGMPEHKREMYSRYTQARRLRMASGLTVSIQASETHYCSPRLNLLCNQYTEFELGFPNRDMPELSQWLEGYGCDIYPYTPIEAIELMVNNNGGVVGYEGSN